eukprot:365381-Chlamydomonas_euryale.AAC.33
MYIHAPSQLPSQPPNRPPSHKCIQPASVSVRHALVPSHPIPCHPIPSHTVQALPRLVPYHTTPYLPSFQIQTHPSAPGIHASMTLHGQLDCLPRSVLLSEGRAPPPLPNLHNKFHPDQLFVLEGVVQQQAAANMRAEANDPTGFKSTAHA